MALNLLGPHVTVVVNIHRPTRILTGTGGSTPSYTTVQRKARVVLQKLTGGLAQLAFGVDSTSRWKLITPAGMDIKARDLVEVVTGPDAGTNLEVDDKIEGRGKLISAALKDTKATPPS